MKGTDGEIELGNSVQPPWLDGDGNIYTYIYHHIFKRNAINDYKHIYVHLSLCLCVCDYVWVSVCLQKKKKVSTNNLVFIYTLSMSVDVLFESK